MSARARRAAVSTVVVLFALLMVESWYPFEAQLPVWWRTTPARIPTGSVRFDGHSVLVSPAPPTWLVMARQSGSLEIDLEVRTERPRQEGPARILTVSRDIHHADIMIGQQGEDLVVRVRRPGSDASGDPAFEVPRLFNDQGWHTISVLVAGDRLRIEADGRIEVNRAIGDGSLLSWDPGYPLALGDEPQGERGWVGELRRVQVVTPAGAMDLLSPGLLEPKRGVVIRTRVRTLLRSTAGDPFYLMVFRVAAFIPIGVAFQRLLRRRLPSLLCIIGLAGLLLVGKVFAAGRHPALADAAWSVVGGLLGYLLGSALQRPRKPGQ